MAEKPTRILLVDDHQVLRDGLKVLLEIEEDIEVIGEAPTGSEVLEKVRALKPDMVIMDLGLPDISGIEVTRNLTEQMPNVAVIVLSMHVQKEFVVKAIEAGAKGYVPKSTTHESLLEAIRRVRSGENYIHPMAASSLFESFSHEKEPEEKKYAQLTHREREVFVLTANGFNSREIGEKLIISPKTVDTYRQRAFEKMGIEHRSELVRVAMHLNILGDPQNPK